MGGTSNQRTILNGHDWMRQIEKRLIREERRPQIRTASDIMGPGLGPYTVEITDWNQPETQFNGFFYSPLQSLNSPDPTESWIGQTQGTADGEGYQLVHQIDPVTGVMTDETMIRYFYTPPGGIITFTPWEPFGGSSTGANPIGPAGGDLTGAYPNPQINGVTFTFAVATTLWPLPHNLSKTYVQIFTTDNGLVETYGNVRHLDGNNAEVRWTVPMTGFARVSA